jgi:maltooligosyltrehalose synthase
MSEKSSKIQAEFKDRNRQEENLDYIKPKNNSHSRLQVWQGANSQLNYRNPKEIDSLPVSNEGIAEDE